MVGVTGGDSAHRGYLNAFDARTGRRAWRFWTIPGPGEKGHETWKGDSWKYGGGATWMTGSYDPELNLIYWGVGNPAADFYGGDPDRGQPLYRFRRGPGCRQRGAEVVLPADPPRRLGLGYRLRMRADRPAGQRQETQAVDQSQQGRVHLGPRQDQRRVHRRLALRRKHQLDRGDRFDREAAGTAAAPGGEAHPGVPGHRRALEAGTTVPTAPRRGCSTIPASSGVRPSPCRRKTPGRARPFSGGCSSSSLPPRARPAAISTPSIR